jgi:hypothetical protein
MKWPLFVLLSVLAVTNACAQRSAPPGAAEIEKAVMTVLDEYMTSFNALDMKAWERTMHFPHYRLASGEMRIQKGPGELPVDVLRAALGEKWHHSAWQKKSLVHWSKAKVHVDTKFARYREDGSVIASYDSLYILTKEDGRWGVKMRSSLAP